jgi:hypothetical protein
VRDWTSLCSGDTNSCLDTVFGLIDGFVCWHGDSEAFGTTINFEIGCSSSIHWIIEVRIYPDQTNFDIDIGSV